MYRKALGGLSLALEGLIQAQGFGPRGWDLSQALTVQSKTLGGLGQALEDRSQALRGQNQALGDQIQALGDQIQA